MQDAILNQFKSVTPINKGWSGDKKFLVETRDGVRYLMRISDISEYDKKKVEFDNMQILATAGFKMSWPIDFGICNGGKSVFQLLSWCDGVEAKELLFDKSEEEQFSYGLKAAEILKLMERVERKPESLDWQIAYKRRVDSYIARYRSCGVKFPDDDIVINYLLTHIDCVGERPTALMHEDFQTDNMVISPDGELCVIDFQMCNIVDPYLAMSGVGVSAEFSRSFAMGQMQGYFGNKVPEDFWLKYNYYMAAEMLYAFTVAVTMDEERENAQYMFADEVNRI